MLGTGVNPGFVMDALPIALTAACQRVDRISVSRIQDARNRRLPFQQKIGAGLTTEQFQKRKDDGSIKHVGFTESIAMIADSLGWTLDRITDNVEPKIAQVTISSEYLAVDPGYVCGIVQEGIGYRKKEPVIRLYMEAYLGAPDIVRLDRDRRLAAPVGEDRRRHPRRHRHRRARRQFDSESARRARPGCTRCWTCRCRRSFPGAEVEPDCMPDYQIMDCSILSPSARSAMRVCPYARRARRRDQLRQLRQEIPLDVVAGGARRRRRRPCPVCAGGDFYVRKDFNPKIGVTIVDHRRVDQRGVLLVQARPDCVQHPRVRDAGRSGRSTAG